jgi:hypothetical protein
VKHHALLSLVAYNIVTLNKSQLTAVKTESVTHVKRQQVVNDSASAHDFSNFSSESIYSSCENSHDDNILICVPQNCCVKVPYKHCDVREHLPTNARYSTSIAPLSFAVSNDRLQQNFSAFDRLMTSQHLVSCRDNTEHGTDIRLPLQQIH